MTTYIVLLGLSVTATVASAAETLFVSGPQEYGGRNYYWLAEWKLQVTLPSDIGPGDSLEVLFGSKGPNKRTLYYEYDGQAGSVADVRPTAYEWITLPLGKLAGGQRVLLFGKGRENVAFLAGLRITGQSSSELKCEPVRVAQFSSSTGHAAVWADLPGFEMNDEVRKLWEPRPPEPDWQRAERSSQYAGIALGKVQRWLHEGCLPIRDQRSGLFRPTGAEWNYQDGEVKTWQSHRHGQFRFLFHSLQRLFGRRPRSS